MLQTKPLYEDLRAKEWAEILEEIDELEDFISLARKLHGKIIPADNMRKVIPIAESRIMVLRNSAAGLTGD